MDRWVEVERLYLSRRWNHVAGQQSQGKQQFGLVMLDAHFIVATVWGPCTNGCFGING